MSGTLFLVATPIGNLEDITLRAIRILKEADAIACEDTRVTGVLLKKYEISHAPMIALHQHSDDTRISSVIDRLKKGDNIVYVSDAGTPNVNDPGGRLVEAVYDAGCRIEVIPGASALTSAMSACGFAMEHFRYLGFIPQKKHKASTLKAISEDEDPSVFFESTHRIIKTLKELERTFPENRLIYIGRELTKLHETHYRGTLKSVIAQLEAGSFKGEFVCITGPLLAEKTDSR